MRKAEFIGDLFKYFLVGIVSITILIFGYKIFYSIEERICMTEVTKFEIDLRNIDKSLRFGARELQSYEVPCDVDQVYFFDKTKNINITNLRNIPFIGDSLKSKSSNVFLIKESKMIRSFDAGNLEIIYPYYICFVPKSSKISFFIEGAGKSVKIMLANEQPVCS